MAGSDRTWRTPPGLWRKLKPVARGMRSEPTVAEGILWGALRGRKLGGLRFRRQHPIGRFIVDFYCPDRRLVIEVDGPVHRRSAAEDAARQRHLEHLGMEVLRFTNEQVLASLDTVTSAIVERCASRPPREN